MRREGVWLAENWLANPKTATRPPRKQQLANRYTVESELIILTLECVGAQTTAGRLVSQSDIAVQANVQTTYPTPRPLSSFLFLLSPLALFFIPYRIITPAWRICTRLLFNHGGDKQIDLQIPSRSLTLRGPLQVFPFASRTITLLTWSGPL